MPTPTASRSRRPSKKTNEPEPVRHRLYADEDVPLPVVRALRAFGHDVVTAFEVGNANRRMPDEEALRWAAGSGRAVVTGNRRDFARLHRLTPEHAGIVVCSKDLDHAALAHRIHRGIDSIDDLSNRLIRVHRVSS